MSAAGSERRMYLVYTEPVTERRWTRSRYTPKNACMQAEMAWSVFSAEALRRAICFAAFCAGLAPGLSRDWKDLLAPFGGRRAAAIANGGLRGRCREKGSRSLL